MVRVVLLKSILCLFFSGMLKCWLMRCVVRLE